MTGENIEVRPGQVFITIHGHNSKPESQKLDYDLAVGITPGRFSIIHLGQQHGSKVDVSSDNTIYIQYTSYATSNLLIRPCIEVSSVGVYAPEKPGYHIFDVKETDHIPEKLIHRAQMLQSRLSNKK